LLLRSALPNVSAPYRDAIGALQKAITATEEKDITADVLQMLSDTPSGESVQTIIKALSTGDIDAALTASQNALAGNVSEEALFQEILAALRAILLLRYGKDNNFKSFHTPEAIALFEELAKTSSLTAASLRTFLEHSALVGKSSVKGLALELAILSLIGQD